MLEYEVSAIDDLLKRNADYVASRENLKRLEAKPTMPVAVLTCLDARINIGRVMGLREGDLHVLRNAGATVTDDAIRSLAISQVLHGTDQIMLIKHTDCAMIRHGEDELRDMLTAATGTKPTASLGTFDDLDENTRSELRKIRESPLLVNKGCVRGFVLDVKSCRLREVI
jgi:carbonic anhydrase